MKGARRCARGRRRGDHLEGLVAGPGSAPEFRNQTAKIRCGGDGGRHLLVQRMNRAVVSNVTSTMRIIMIVIMLMMIRIHDGRHRVLGMLDLEIHVVMNHRSDQEEKQKI